MARKSNAISPYIVGIHKTGAYTYASTQRQILAEKKHKGFRHIHWGRLTDDKIFIPNSNYYECPIDELKKFIFPKEWNIDSHVNHLKHYASDSSAYSLTDLNRLYGSVWLLEQIANDVGIIKDLEEVFDGDKKLVDEVMTLAMYLVIQKSSFSRLAMAQKIIKFPAQRELKSPAITRLMQSITEHHRQKLFSLRMKRLPEDDLVSVDSTSRSSYGNTLSDIRWGKNKEGLPLKQTVEVVVYSLTSHVPIYYRTFPGNIPDSRSLETILSELEYAGFNGIPIVTDRGYESVNNLEMYIRKGQPMIMCTKTSQKHVQEIIDKINVNEIGVEGMNLDVDSRIYNSQHVIKYDIRNQDETVLSSNNLCLNLFLNRELRTSNLLEMDWEIEVQRKALNTLLETQTPVEDDDSIKKLYSWYQLDIDKNTRLLKSYNKNEKKINKAKKIAGFFSITTHSVDMDAIKVLETYKLRDEQEKCFELMKTGLGMNRQKNWSEDGKTGSLFILFVSMILGSWLRYKWKTCLKDKFKSSIEILDEMSSIRCIEHKGSTMKITPFVGAQVEICKAFGYEIPKGCAPTYESARVVEPKKRGRPKKVK